MAKPPITAIKNIFSLTSREQCMSSFKKIIIPKFSTVPKQTASVLIPLCKIEEVPSILYTVRAAHLRTNSGDVAFPGGKTDKDEDAIQTALRETFEEIGLTKDKIDIWGPGTPVPGRNNKVLITPVVGSIRDLKQEDLNVNKNEVTEVFTVPIEDLCDSKNHFYTQFKNGFVLPVFLVDEYKIWGVTAYLTHAFLSSALSKDIYNNEWNKRKVILDKMLTA